MGVIVATENTKETFHYRSAVREFLNALHRRIRNVLSRMESEQIRITNLRISIENLHPFWKFWKKSKYVCVLSMMTSQGNLEKIVETGLLPEGIPESRFLDEVERYLKMHRKDSYFSYGIHPFEVKSSFFDGNTKLEYMEHEDKKYSLEKSENAINTETELVAFMNERMQQVIDMLNGCTDALQIQKWKIVFRRWHLRCETDKNKYLSMEIENGATLGCTVLFGKNVISHTKVFIKESLGGSNSLFCRSFEYPKNGIIVRNIHSSFYRSEFQFHSNVPIRFVFGRRKTKTIFII